MPAEDLPSRGERGTRRCPDGNRRSSTSYFVNTLAIMLALIWRPGRTRGRSDGWALPVALGILVLGGVIELAQAGFADRDAQFGDWIADAVGVVLALCVFTFMRWVSDRRRREHPTP